MMRMMGCNNGRYVRNFLRSDCAIDEKTVVLHKKENQGFGFVLRGAKGKQKKFSPSSSSSSSSSPSSSSSSPSSSPCSSSSYTHRPLLLRQHLLPRHLPASHHLLHAILRSSHHPVHLTWSSDLADYLLLSFHFERHRRLYCRRSVPRAVSSTDPSRSSHFQSRHVFLSSSWTGPSSSFITSSCETYFQKPTSSPLSRSSHLQPIGVVLRLHELVLKFIY